MRHPTHNIWKCYFLSGSWALILLQSVMLPFLQYRSLSLTEIFWLQSIFSIVLICCEIPSGYFADRFGRKKTLIYAALWKAVGATGFAIMPDFFGLAFSYALIAIGNSLYSGTLTALLYESHGELKHSSKPTRHHLGNMHLIGYLGMLFASLCSGFLAEHSLQLVADINAFVAWISLPIAALLEDSRQHHTPQHSVSWSSFKTNTLGYTPELKMIVTIYIMSMLSSMSALYLIQASWTHLSVPLKWFGLLAAAQNLWNGLFGRAAHHITTKFGRKRVITALICLPALAYTGLSLPSVWSVFVAALLLETLRAGAAVILIDEFNQKIKSMGRATANSVLQFLSRGSLAIAAPLLGATAEHAGLHQTILGMAIVYLAFGSWLFHQWQKTYDMATTLHGDCHETA